MTANKLLKTRGFFNKNQKSNSFALFFEASKISLCKNGETHRKTSNIYACENTNDKIFLLNLEEVTDTANGFLNNRNDDINRVAYKMEYVGNGAGYWWLRSPNYYNSSDAWFVYNGGSVHNISVNNDNVNRAYSGIRPALQFSI